MDKPDGPDLRLVEGGAYEGVESLPPIHHVGRALYMYRLSRLTRDYPASVEEVDEMLSRVVEEVFQEVPVLEYLPSIIDPEDFRTFFLLDFDRWMVLIDEAIAFGYRLDGALYVSELRKLLSVDPDVFKAALDDFGEDGFFAAVNSWGYDEFQQIKLLLGFMIGQTQIYGVPNTVNEFADLLCTAACAHVALRDPDPRTRERIIAVAERLGGFGQLLIMGNLANTVSIDDGADLSIPEAPESDDLEEIVGNADEPFAEKIIERRERVRTKFMVDLGMGARNFTEGIPVLTSYLMDRDNARGVATRILAPFVSVGV